MGRGGRAGKLEGAEVEGGGLDAARRRAAATQSCPSAPLSNTDESTFRHQSPLAPTCQSGCSIAVSKLLYMAATRLRVMPRKVA